MARVESREIDKTFRGGFIQVFYDHYPERVIHDYLHSGQNVEAAESLEIDGAFRLGPITWRLKVWGIPSEPFSISIGLDWK